MRRSPFTHCFNFSGIILHFLLGQFDSSYSSRSSVRTYDISKANITLRWTLSLSLLRQIKSYRPSSLHGNNMIVNFHAYVARLPHFYFFNTGLSGTSLVLTCYIFMGGAPPFNPEKFCYSFFQRLHGISHPSAHVTRHLIAA